MAALAAAGGAGLDGVGSRARTRRPVVHLRHARALQAAGLTPSQIFFITRRRRVRGNCHLAPLPDRARPGPLRGRHAARRRPRRPAPSGCPLSPAASRPRRARLDAAPRHRHHAGRSGHARRLVDGDPRRAARGDRSRVSCPAQSLRTSTSTGSIARHGRWTWRPAATTFVVECLAWRRPSRGREREAAAAARGDCWRRSTPRAARRAPTCWCSTCARPARSPITSSICTGQNPRQVQAIADGGGRALKARRCGRRTSRLRARRVGAARLLRLRRPRLLARRAAVLRPRAAVGRAPAPRSTSPEPTTRRVLTAPRGASAAELLPPTLAERAARRAARAALLRRLRRACSTGRSTAPCATAAGRASPASARRSAPAAASRCRARARISRSAAAPARSRWGQRPPPARSAPTTACCPTSSTRSSTTRRPSMARAAGGADARAPARDVLAGADVVGAGAAAPPPPARARLQSG